MTAPIRPRSPAQDAMIALFSAAGAARRHISAELERFGLAPQQYNVLRILRGAHPQALPTMEIVERMLERAPGITRLIDRLEEKGLVARSRSPNDRRSMHCAITERGLALLAEMDRPIDEADMAVFAALDEAEIGQLHALLDRVRAGLD